MDYNYYTNLCYYCWSAIGSPPIAYSDWCRCDCCGKEDDDIRVINDKDIVRKKFLEVQKARKTNK